MRPESDAEKLKAIQEEMKEATKTTEEFVSSIIQMYEKALEEKEIEIEFKEFLYKLGLECIDVTRGSGEVLEPIKGASNYFGIHATTPNRTVPGDSEFCSNLLQFCMTKSLNFESVLRLP